MLPMSCPVAAAGIGQVRQRHRYQAKAEVERLTLGKMLRAVADTGLQSVAAKTFLIAARVAAAMRPCKRMGRPTESWWAAAR